MKHIDRDDTSIGYNICGETHKGRVRTENQDYFKLVTPRDEALNNGTDFIAIVADGMGGHQGGAVASKLASKKLSELLTNLPYSDCADCKSFESALSIAIHETNTFVYTEARNQGLEGMGTTLVVAVVIGNQLYIGNVGDSRAYILPKESSTLELVTKDHSWVMEQVEAGFIDAKEALDHPRRNIITRSIGTASEVTPDIFQRVISDGDRLLLCTDGLHPEIGETKLASLLQGKNFNNICKDLVDAANDSGGHDNITAVTIEFDYTGKKHKMKENRGDDSTLPMSRSYFTKIKDVVLRFSKF